MTEIQIESLKGILSRMKADGQLKPKYQDLAVEELAQIVQRGLEEGEHSQTKE